MKPARSRSPAYVVGCFWLGCQAVPAQAFEVIADAQMTSEYTSNTLRTEDDEIGEWIHQPGADLTATHDTATLELDADYSYIRRIYSKDYWQDENRLVGGADARWEPISNRLDFLLRHNRRESTQRALQTSTQDNRQIVNTTEAGTTLRFQPRASDELQIEYTFTDIKADETSTDSQRHNGTGRYLIDLSPNRRVTVLGAHSDIDYIDSLFPDATYSKATLGFTQTSSEVDLDVNAGYNWYDRDGRGKEDDPAFDATLTWRAVPGSTFTLSGSHGITDQSQSLSERGTEGVDENTDINAAFKETIGRFSYIQQLGSTNTLEFSANYGREKYADDSPRSNTRVGGGAAFRRAMTPRMDFDLYADFSNRDFEDQLDDQDELRAGANLRYRVGRALSLNLGARFEKRDAARTESYEEWIGSLQVLYTVWGADR